MKKLLCILVCYIPYLLQAQAPVINYEWLSLGGGFIYSLEDQYTGLNGKINFPLGSNGKLVMQGTLFPNQLQNPAENYDEIRAKFNVEFTPVKLKHAYLSLQTGFDYGGWRRNYEVQGSTLGTDWKRDESMMFGAIFNYDFHRYRLYVDYMYMPKIYSNHLGIGITMLFFESKLYRRMYMQRRSLNSNTWWRVRDKGKRTTTKNNKVKG